MSRLLVDYDRTSRPHVAFGFLYVSVNHRTRRMPKRRVCVFMSHEGHVMAVTMWRCPECPLILVGPQIAGAEQHLETHKENPDV